MKLFLPLLAISLPLLGNAQTLQQKSVSIFKNNQAFIIKEGSVPVNDGRYQITENFPKAYLGTFWLYNSSNSISYITSQRDSITKSVKLHSIGDILESNIGKKVVLKVREAHNTVITLEGTIEQVNRTGNTAQVGILILKTKEGWYSTTLGEVVAVQQMEQPTLLQEKQEMHALSIHFKDGSKKQQELGMMYLASGLAWAPVYWLEITSEKKGNLVLNAEVSNEAEDLNNTQLNFVAGVPQFNHNGQLSMLLRFLGQERIVELDQFQTFGNSVLPRGNAYMAAEKEVVNMDVSISGQSVQDMFYYTVKNVSLRKGGNASFEILRGELELNHVFRSNLPSNSYYGDLQSHKSTVEHFLCFSNNLSFPLTSGAIFISDLTGKTRLPVAQSVLNYTSVKGSNEVYVGQAIDIQVEQKEKEISRQNINKTWQNERYVLITVECTVKLNNRKKEAMELELKRTIYGEVKSNPNNFKITPVPPNGWLNRQQILDLKVPLKAGEEKTITYTYEVYTRI